MELYDQIRRISFVFFFLVGLAHFLAGFMFMNGYFVPESGIINRVLFIPFVVATITYAFSNLKYHLLELEKDAKWLNYTLIGIGVAIFLGLLVIELFVVDSSCPLSKC